MLLHRFVATVTPRKDIDSQCPNFLQPQRTLLAHIGSARRVTAPIDLGEGAYSTSHTSLPAC